MADDFEEESFTMTMTATIRLPRDPTLRWRQYVGRTDPRECALFDYLSNPVMFIADWCRDLEILSVVKKEPS